MGRKVVVTGMGCISGLGNTLPASWTNAIAGRSAIRDVKIAAEGDESMQYAGIAAPVDSDPHAQLKDRFDRRKVNGVDRFSAFAMIATDEALSDAGIAAGDEMLRDAAIIYGAASGGNTAAETNYQRLFGLERTLVHPLTIPRGMASAASSHLSMLFGIQGLCFCISSACASSAHAISEAMHLIRSGRADVVVTGGSDASLTYGLLQSWEALQALADDTCRPFSRDRKGVVLGEGAATLILESADHARQRGAKIYAEVAGSGSSADAAHLTQPNAQTAAKAVRCAHSDAGVPLSTPLLISTHGTGTALNDRMESAMLHRVYGGSLNASRVIATKALHGHMLGAAGAMEFLLTIMALQDRKVPPVLGYLGADPECDVPLALSTEAIDFDTAISTSFAFGGLNCALIARRTA